MNANTFSNHISKFILLLAKNINPSVCTYDWKKFNEIPLPEKEDFYSNLNMEDITDASHTQR